MKKLLTILLSFLALTSFGQTHTTHTIGTPLVGDSGISVSGGRIVSDTTVIKKVTIAQLQANTKTSLGNFIFQTTDSGAVGTWRQRTFVPGMVNNVGMWIQDAASQWWERQTTQDVQSTWFLMDRSGTNDSKAKLKAFFALADSGYNLNLHLVKGKYMLSDTLIVGSFYNSTVYGDDSTSELVSPNSPGILQIGNLVNSTIRNIFFHITNVHTAQDFGRGAIYSIGNHTWNSHVEYCKFVNQSANSTAINFIAWAASTPKGSIQSLYIRYNRIESSGQSGIAVFNRDTATLAFSGTRGADSCIDVHVDGNYIANLGKSGTNGTGLTLDGVSNGGTCNYNTFVANYDIIIENTGFNNFEFGWNYFYAGSNGRTPNVLGFSSRPMTNNSIHNNYCMDSLGGIAVIGVSNSVIKDNVFISKGISQYAGLRNSNGITSSGNYYIGQGFFALQVQSTGSSTGQGNTFTNDHFDNSVSATNQGVLSWDGANTGHNSFIHCYYNKGASGNYIGVTNGASITTNYVDQLIKYSDTTDFQSNYLAVTLADADTTLAGDASGITHKFIRVNGTTTATRNIYFTNLAQANFVFFNGTNGDLNVVYKNSGSTVTVKSFARVTISNDGTNYLVSGGYFTSQYNGFLPFYMSNYRWWIASTGVPYISNTAGQPATETSGTGLQLMNPQGGFPFTSVLSRTSPVLNAFTANDYRVDLTGGNMTMAGPSNFLTGEALYIRVSQDSVVGGRTITWNSAYKFKNTIPVLSSTPRAVDYLGFKYDTTTSTSTGAGWYCFLFNRGDGPLINGGYEESGAQTGVNSTASDTVLANVTKLYEDPTSTLASKTIVLCAPASNIGEGHIVKIFFGGTVTSGAVITALTVSAQTGTSIIQNATPTTALAGDFLEYEYRFTNSTTGKYYRLH